MSRPATTERPMPNTMMWTMPLTHLSMPECAPTRWTADLDNLPAATPPKPKRAPKPRPNPWTK